MYFNFAWIAIFGPGASILRSVLQSALPMAEPTAKQRKLLSSWTSVPAISAVAFSHMLRLAKDDSLPEGSRQDLIRARAAAAYESTCVEVGGEKIEIADPAAHLYLASNQAGFQVLMRRAIAASPGGALGVIIYCDEVTPGNIVAHKNARKVWAVYWSISQFEQSLSNEDLGAYNLLHLHCAAGSRGMLMQ
jgi:hypothetical protein